MSLRSFIIIVLLQLTLEIYGQAQQKFFRKDYKFSEDTQSFYKLFTITKSYRDAVKTCSRQGATLFFPEDRRELEAVVKFWTQPRYLIFIGVSSLISKGVFTTVDGYIINEDLGRCYKFFSTPTNWTEAFAICNAEESYLAIINSDEEAEYLKKLTKDNPKHTVKDNYLPGVVMLGFYNRDQQGWLTIKGTTLEDSGYSRWGYAQPNVDDKYLCGAMFYNGELTYGDCSERSFFICEKEYKSGFDERFGEE